MQTADLELDLLCRWGGVRAHVVLWLSATVLSANPQEIQPSAAGAAGSRSSRGEPVAGAAACTKPTQLIVSEAKAEEVAGHVAPEWLPDAIPE